MSNIPSASKETHRTVQGPATAVADHEEGMERLAVLLQDCLGATDESVDCFLLDVPVAADKAQERRTEIIELLDRWPTETGDGPVSPLSAGPGYIHVGAVLGSQRLAFILFAVGKVLGLWRIITPKDLGFEGEAAVEMARRGLVMIDGYRPDGGAAG